ncbi:hypothetical protein B0A52_05145 [Exophiala mesophila]|uniref:Cyclase n=1 Tax=Exophiala mesophila TaxID=212818 RepID=A0A438N437_EXOME|nr:hypothetical protein B0A52_05145 [Exophiala mesophila]
MRFDPDSDQLPSRNSLPSIEGAPFGAAWFWGEEDQIGRLNLLTPQRICSSARLVTQGEVVNLNWRADLPNPAVFGRDPFQHTIKQLSDSVFDDLYNMNTQSGSQWDGFRHVGHSHNGAIVFYNNLSADEIKNSSRCGMQAWSDHGIVGRGVLLDYWDFVQKKYDPNTTHRITLSELQGCAEEQGTTFQPGDVLLIRSGWVDTYNKMDENQRTKLGSVPPNRCTFVGVEQSQEMIDFLHDNYFSAVGGDAPAFEAWPSNQPWYHHEYLLSLWGVPIGEMFDLEKLSVVCKKLGRHTFFFTSSPANVSGGVGSTPNAMAIF